MVKAVPVAHQLVQHGHERRVREQPPERRGVVLGPAEHGAAVAAACRLIAYVCGLARVAQRAVPLVEVLRVRGQRRAQGAHLGGREAAAQHDVAEGVEHVAFLGGESGAAAAAAAAANDDRRLRRRAGAAGKGGGGGGGGGGGDGAVKAGRRAAVLQKTARAREHPCVFAQPRSTRNKRHVIARHDLGVAVANCRQIVLRLFRFY